MASLIAFSSCASDDLPPEGPLPAEGPAFIAVSTVFSGDEALSYVTPLTTLEADQDIDYTRSIEKGAIPRLYADLPARSRFFLGEGQEPTIESYRVVQTRLESGERLSLLDLGVTNFDNAGYILSGEKAYYYDYASLQVIVWNPQTMEILSTIDVSDVEREGVTAYFAYSNPGLAGQYLFFNLQYYTGEPDYFPSAGSVLVVVDTATDTLEAIDVDDRCDAVANWVRTEDGTVWFASGMAAIQNVYFDLGLTTNCMLKLAPDGRGFDDDYFFDLGTAIDSPIVGTMVLAGPNAVYVKALDEELLTIEEAEEVSDFFTSVYRFWRVDLTTMTATRDTVLPPTGSGGYFFDVDGQTYADESAADFSETTLWHMNAPGGPQRGVTLRGYVYGLARVR